MKVLGPDEKDITIGGGRYPGVGNVLSGGGTNGTVLQIRVVGHIRGNEKYGGGIPCSITKANQ